MYDPPGQLPFHEGKAHPLGQQLPMSKSPAAASRPPCPVPPGWSQAGSQRRSASSQQSHHVPSCRWREGRNLRKHLGGIWPTKDTMSRSSPPPKLMTADVSHPDHSELAAQLPWPHSVPSPETAITAFSHHLLPTHSTWATRSLCAPSL